MKVIVAAMLVLMNSIAVAESPVVGGPGCDPRLEALKTRAAKRQKEPRPAKQISIRGIHA
jgi:hypothetical protein